MISRLKTAELTSASGVLAIGVGLGALLASTVSPRAGLLIVAGIAIHGFGMWDKHRLERGQPAESGFIALLYWACWSVLASLAVLIALMRS